MDMAVTGIPQGFGSRIARDADKPVFHGGGGLCYICRIGCESTRAEREAVLFKSKYIGWLRQHAGKKGPQIIVLAIFGGLLQSGVVMVINGALSAMTQDSLNFRYFLLFILCMSGYILSVRYAVSRTINLSGELIYNTQKRLVKKLRDSDYITFESTEKSSIYKNLIESTDILFETSRSLVNGLSGVAMLFGSAVYVAVLSIEAFIIIVSLVVIGVYIFTKIQSRVNQYLSKSKKEEVKFLKLFDDLVNGFTEVKMSRNRGDDLLRNHLNMRSDLARGSRLTTEGFITTNIIFAQSFFLALVGCMVFLLPQFGEQASTPIVQLVPVVLFFIGPLGAIIAAVPLIAKSDYAVESISELEQVLDAKNEIKDTVEISPWGDKPKLESLKLESLIFKYKNNSGNGSFQLGPIDMEISPGQILFLVGGNGTGKSTLMKVLGGLYHAQFGSLRLNGIEVNQTNYMHYRELFSLILADFHIFERLYGLWDVTDEQVNQSLQRLELDQRVKYQNRKFSTVNLSTGQRKRMALLTSLLEEKPILLFDEVAADFDPNFRKYYYTSLLPELKEQGRTIIVVSHDDRYFHLADRVIKLDFGHISDNDKT
jgi:putative ATP-binding cassette transporter